MPRLHHSSPVCLARLLFAGWLARLLVASLACGWLASAEAAVITVTNTADSGAGSFRQAIADAQENDTVTFAPEVRGTIALMSGQLLISKGITIQGPGANLLSIQGGNAGNAENESRVLRINAYGETVTIAGLTFTGGSTKFELEGGGIWNNSNLTLTACTVRACTSAAGLGWSNPDARGGGIFNQSGSSIQLVRCTLSGNRAGGGSSFHGSPAGFGHGGAVWNAGDMALQNCTITGNTATGGSSCGQWFCNGPGSGKGAGIYNTNDLLITASTIASNAASGPGSATGGGGIWNEGNAQITNSIVAENASATSPDAAGTFESSGFNLIGRIDGSSGFTAMGDQTGNVAVPLDPMLGPLQDNGGPTGTLALLPGSPAIDAGISANIWTDQRGGVRTHDDPEIPNAPGGDGTDIGSFEVGSLGIRLGNISTRLRVQTGDNAMIGGFIISGTQPKTVVVRGIGPSLPVPGALADPVIEVHGSSGELLASNDNWMDADTRQQIIDSGLAPANDLESALWGIINPGTYTVVVRGKNDATGVGLFEVYDLDETVDSKLGNISTRGPVETGDDVMIGGTIIVGNDPARVLLRAIGPSLTNFGVANALPDPTLELHDGNGALLASNDNWRSDQETEIIATTIPPSSDLEPAILRDLTPGNYTAILRGVDNTTGVAVVEAFGLN